jgi:chorismate mutase / prephenate dehydratase
MGKKKQSPDITKELDKLRNKINAFDDSILDALNQRTQIVLKIAEIKKKSSSSFYVPHREQQIYQRLVKLNKGPFTNEAVKAVFREIMSASIALEKKLKIAYLGPEASFTHTAAMHRFGSQMEYVPLDSISSVFTEVGKKWSDYGVIPIENSTEGVINHTLDMFIDSDLKICSEIVLVISENLLGMGKLKDIRKVYSRDSALAQCRQWLLNNLPQAELVAVSSTTRGVQLAKKNPRAAAIAGALAASIYDIPILAKGIEDIPGNRTRFLVIGETESKKSGQDKTSIMFSIKDKVGALYQALKPFQKYKINLTKIESRPSRRRAWDYVFFVDFEGYKDDPIVAKALKEVMEHCMYLRVLGSYPSSHDKRS